MKLRDLGLLAIILGACNITIGQNGPPPGSVPPDAHVSAHDGAPSPDGGIVEPLVDAPDGVVEPPIDGPPPVIPPAQILAAMPFMESIQGVHLGDCLVMHGGVVKPGACSARAAFVKDPPTSSQRNFGLFFDLTYGATGDEYNFQAWPSFLLTGSLYELGDLSMPVEVLAASATKLKYKHQHTFGSNTYTLTKTFEYVDGALEVKFVYEKPNTPTIIAFAVFE